MGKCEIKECRNYSDVDVYFDDGTSESLCSNHAALNWDSPKVDQVVPQHGGECNLPYRDPNRGKRVRVTVDAKIVGPCLHWKTKEVIGYHVDIKLGNQRALVHTMIPLKDIQGGLR